MRQLPTLFGSLAFISAFSVARRHARRRPVAGQVVIITGGSRGLGLCMARALVARRARVVICARDRDELEAAKQQLSSAEVRAVVADVGEPHDMERVVREAVDSFGRVDVLIASAGNMQVGPYDTMTLADFQESMRVNFFGLLHATLAVLPHMRRQGAGRIVHITSIGGAVSVPHVLPYSSAKFAALGFSEGLRAELAQEGIGVTTIVPGLMRTGSPENASFKGEREREYLWFAGGDAQPLTAMSADRAALRIVHAIEQGEGHVTLGWQAKVLRVAHGVFPAATVWLLGQINRLLPRTPSAPRTSALGREIADRSPTVRGWLERDARRNNQYGRSR